jgi:hypothetical protein
MGTYKRLPTREKRLQGEGEVGTWLEMVYRWLEINWRAVAAGIATLLIVIAAVFLVAKLVGAKDEKARVAYYEATKFAPGSEEAINAYNKVIESFSGSGAANAARLKLGDIYYDKGEYDKIVEVLTPAVKAKELLIKTIAMNNIAAAKFAKGDFEGAASEYLKAYSNEKNPTRGISYFNAGLAYVQAGKIDEAKSVFAELSNEETKFTTPELKEKSLRQMIWIAAKK